MLERSSGMSNSRTLFGIAARPVQGCYVWPFRISQMAPTRWQGSLEVVCGSQEALIMPIVGEVAMMTSIGQITFPTAIGQSLGADVGFKLGIDYPLSDPAILLFWRELALLL